MVKIYAHFQISLETIPFGAAQTYLHHAENTAIQNTGEPVYIWRYTTRKRCVTII